MVDMPLELDTASGDDSGTITTCSPDPQIRAHAIELTKQWIDRAAMIERPSVMVNQGRTWGDDLTPIIDALKTLRDYGEPEERCHHHGRAGTRHPYRHAREGNPGVRGSRKSRYG